jgi:hypothetical protein
VLEGKKSRAIHVLDNKRGLSNKKPGKSSSCNQTKLQKPTNKLNQLFHCNFMFILLYLFVPIFNGKISWKNHMKIFNVIEKFFIQLQFLDFLN